MILTRTGVYSIALIVLTINIEHTLSCLCKLIKFKCPAPPTCCESGQYALDECGCCLKCAKAELQTCGGANDISGRCAGGLQCLKTCLPCKTVGDKGKPCIFPFEYSGRTYDKCTTRDSDNGQPWCATEVDATGYVVDNAWGDCLEGCPGTRVECDDKYFSIQEGKCIDVSVPGAIPNWFGAPAVKLLDSTTGLVTAKTCKNKGAVVRLYDNTCRCVRGETAVDLDLRGTPRGNCTGLEDDSTDNLDKVWCFLENIRDPLEPKSGCYSDTIWSERDGRFWSALACFQAPDIEGANNPAIHPGNVNIPKFSSQGRNQRPRNPPTSRRTTRMTTTTTRRTTTTSDPAEHAHTFNFTYDYEYIDYDEYYGEQKEVVDFGAQVPAVTLKKEDEEEDRGYEFIPGETNLPGFKEQEDVSFGPQEATEIQKPKEEKDEEEDRGYEFIPEETNLPGFKEQEDVSVGPQEATEIQKPKEEKDDRGYEFIPGETNLSGVKEAGGISYDNYYEEYQEDEAAQITKQKEQDGLELIPLETNLQDLEEEYQIAIEKNGGTEEKFVSVEITTEYVQDLVEIEEATEKAEINIFDDLNELINEINHKSLSNDNVQNQGNEDEHNIQTLSSFVKSSIEDDLDELFKDAVNLNTRITPAENLSTKPTFISNTPKLQRKQRPRKVSQARQKPQKSPEINAVTETPKKSSTALDNDHTLELSSDLPEVTTTTTTSTEVLPTRTPKRRPRPRKRAHRNKQRKVTTNSPTIEQHIEARTEVIVGPQLLEDSGYELYTEQNVESTTVTPDFLFGFNINL